MMLNGCDISHWNRTIPSNVDFAIVKATEGKTFIDPKFYEFVDAAVARNILLGAYHFARPDNNSAEEEANHFVSKVKPYIGNCLLALDWEGEAWNYPIEWALEWLNNVKQLTGVNPILYFNYSRRKTVKPIIDAGYSLWVARWSENKPEGINPLIWQYSSKPYDQDFFYGTECGWNEFCKVHKEWKKTTKCGCGCECCK